jgi:hypothetical protein
MGFTLGHTNSIAFALRSALREPPWTSWVPEAWRLVILRIGHWTAFVAQADLSRLHFERLFCFGIASHIRLHRCCVTTFIPP